jgi:hypothetical protein
MKKRRSKCGVVLLCALCILLPATLAADDCTKQVKPLSMFDTIELLRRNWENHGTDIRISSDGAYTVTAQYLGRSRKVRAGKIPPDRLEAVREDLRAADISNLKSEYEPAPVDMKPAWWGYELTIKSEKQAKTIRFHSEDKSVPESLKLLVENIMALTQ